MFDKDADVHDVDAELVHVIVDDVDVELVHVELVHVTELDVDAEDALGKDVDM